VVTSRLCYIACGLEGLCIVTVSSMLCAAGLAVGMPDDLSDSGQAVTWYLETSLCQTYLAVQVGLNGFASVTI